MKPRTKPVPATQKARDRIANDVAKGRLTIDQAHAELDKLEAESTPWHQPEPLTDQASAADQSLAVRCTKCGMRYEYEHVDDIDDECQECAESRFAHWDESREALARALRPKYFEARAGLKDEMVEALDAIQLRMVLAAGMVC